jgi:CelD/BcsL family acetyltransferase involved in cellulose biosynthesis
MPETFETLNAFWRNGAGDLQWDCLFVLPGWLRSWWQSFGTDSELFIRSVRYKDELIGIAPLRRQGTEAAFIGDIEVCDYQDFIVSPGREVLFFKGLMDHLRHQGARRLHLRPVGPDSTVMVSLKESAERSNRNLSCMSMDAALASDLPASWGAFLHQLSGRQRHEVRRKLRRLNEAGRIRFRRVEGAGHIRNHMDTFLRLFKSNRFDKAAFMNDRMTVYFKTLTDVMAEADILRLFFLDVDDQPAAAALCFDYRSSRYLYNNGYDDRFSALSVGLICKILTIKDAVENGMKKYDFLKGAEAYKHRLGGNPMPLYSCTVEL